MDSTDMTPRLMPKAEAAAQLLSSAHEIGTKALAIEACPSEVTEWALRELVATIETALKLLPKLPAQAGDPRRLQ